MKKIHLLIICCLTTSISYAQFSISGQLYVGKDAIVTSNSEIINNGHLQVEGNLHVRNGISNNGDISMPGTLVMDGIGSQKIDGTTAVVTKNALLSQSGSVILKNALLIEENLKMEKGIIETSEVTPVQIGTIGRILGASDDSHVKGYIQKLDGGDFEYPVGDGTKLYSFSTNNVNDDIQVGFISRHPDRISNKYAEEVESLLLTNYWTVKTKNNTDISNVSIGNIASESQILQLKNSEWQVTPTITKQNLVSSDVSLKGISYFTIGTKKISQGEEPGMYIYPNPSNGSFEINLKGFNSEDNLSVDIADLNGKILLKQHGQVKNLSNKYSLGQEVPSGSYILKVAREGKNQTFTQKLIIQK